MVGFRGIELDILLKQQQVWRLLASWLQLRSLSIAGGKDRADRDPSGFMSKAFWTSQNLQEGERKQKKKEARKKSIAKYNGLHFANSGKSEEPGHAGSHPVAELKASLTHAGKSGTSLKRQD